MTQGCALLGGCCALLRRPALPRRSAFQVTSVTCIAEGLSARGSASCQAGLRAE